MPLWKLYHTKDAFTVEDRAEIADRVTNIVYPHLPAFYVGVVFHEVSPENFFIGGKHADHFVRIWIDHIARTLPTPEMKANWLERAHRAILPIFEKRGFRWEFHVDETPRELWSIQGMLPPLPNTPEEILWKTENHPVPLQTSSALAG